MAFCSLTHQQPNMLLRHCSESVDLLTVPNLKQQLAMLIAEKVMKIDFADGY
jgi:hypothetical protein